MSSDTSDDQTDEFELPAVDDDVVSTGAAADSSGWDERLKGLPRLLRYAMLVGDNARHVQQRLVAEIDELCPNLPLNAAWAAALDTATGLTLATELDHRAVIQNEPALRSLADSVRLVCLPVPRDVGLFDEYRRVGKALLQAFNNAVHGGDDEQLCCDIERFVFGWAALPACTDLLSKNVLAAPSAAILGTRMAEHRIAAAKAAVRRQMDQQEARRNEREAEQAAARLQQEASPAAEAIPERHLVVARLSKDEMKNPKLREIINPLKAVINVALPLVEVPALHQVRNALVFEFPYACDAIDFALADLVGRSTIRLRSLLLVGDPGAGKSRFARRLGELLGLGVWREDASRADGAVFGGTDRRWYSAEPCHPLLAIAQAKIGNPVILIDELEKAGTRSDHGRLWDCLLSFLEPETSVRYPDPALQTTLDLSQVSYIATANSLDPLPAPIRDRFRIVAFPKPAAGDLDALLPAVMADLAGERGVDQNWLPPLDGTELTAIARHWRGGSVRRLRRIVEVVLRERDIRATRN